MVEWVGAPSIKKFHFFNCGVMGYMLLAHQPIHSFSHSIPFWFHLFFLHFLQFFNFLFTSISSSLQEKAGSKADEMKEELSSGMKFSCARGLVPSHNPLNWKEKGRTTKLLSLIPQFFISLINQQRNEEFAGIAFFSFIKEKTSRRPSNTAEEKKKEEKLPRQATTTRLHKERLVGWMAWLAAPAGLVRRLLFFSPLHQSTFIS